MDVLSVVADCIIEFLANDITKEFTTRDIWYSEYTIENVQSIFNKPNPVKEAKNEYDKWFGQPLKLLGNSKVLLEEKRGVKNYYKVKRKSFFFFFSWNSFSKSFFKLLSDGVFLPQ